MHVPLVIAVCKLLCEVLSVEVNHVINCVVSSLRCLLRVNSELPFNVLLPQLE